MTELPHKNIRAIAIHLPQFHTIPENDEWWGKGFTEWTNVKKAKPLFKGHYQSHVPLNNNYYDLSDNDVLCQQADMASKHGIEGFCFYHYWFNGKKLLEKPIEDMLKEKKPDFPFCLCWANENWTRTWDGLDKLVLMKQEYSLEDDKDHFEYLLPFFKDDRYIKIDGKPVFLVYRTELFPDIQKTSELWRKNAVENGLPGIYLIRVESFTRNVNPESIGFDAAMEFQPNWQNMPKPFLQDFIEKLKRKIFHTGSKNLSKTRIYSYFDFVKTQINTKDHTNYKRYPCVFPGWDNSPRRKNGCLILKDGTPKEYGIWLNKSLNSFKPYSPQENLLFINAWNEWGEGNHLEPCEKWRYSYLEHTEQVLSNYENT